MATYWTRDQVFLFQSMVRSSKWTITDAAGINRIGEVAANGTLNGVEHALLLRPL